MPLCASSWWCVPHSLTRPFWKTTIMSALWMVDRRWAITMQVRPSRALSRASWTTCLKDHRNESWELGSCSLAPLEQALQFLQHLTGSFTVRSVGCDTDSRQLRVCHSGRPLRDSWSIRCSGQSCLLWCQHPTWVLVWVHFLVSSLPMAGSSSTWPRCLGLRHQQGTAGCSSWLLALVWPSPGCLWQ